LQVSNEFVKQLIQLLTASGGLVNLPLGELEQMGIELTLQSLGTPAAILTLRLGAKIYYVPQESTWPTTSSTSSNETDLPPIPDQPLRRRVRPTLDQSQPPLLDAPQHKPVPKSDLDLFLAEQRRISTVENRQLQVEKAERNASRQYPWETRPNPNRKT